MAFNINAHVILSGPKNIKAVTKRIQKQLGTVNARINLVAPKNLSKQIGSFNKGLNRLNKNIRTLQSSATAANSHLQKLGNQLRTLSKTSTQLSQSQTSVQKSLAKTGQNVNEARNEIQAFGKDAALAIRRFAAFTVATGIVFGFVRAIQSATKAAIDYEREIVKIVQVTGASAGRIKELSATIQQLSVSLGVDANELAELGRIFAQTGQTIDQVGDSIRAIARSSLAPSFGEMKNTAEGLIAAMAQFNIAASRSEEVLAGLNAVSKKFAVEAEDMVSVIRRAGGVFSAAAGPMSDPVDSLNELIGIFTAVRSTTRETADTIAVGLRTIFTRIQRRGTIDFLKQFNIELVNTKGHFIGLFPAFQELSRGLGDIIRQGDALTLSAITEELGGVRQVGKLIPAITQFNKALAATKVAGDAAKEGLGKDVALALQPLGKQFELLQQRFNALIRDITQSKTFQNMAKVALSMANAFLSVAETLKPLIPLMTTFAAIKISRGLFDFGTGFIGGLKKGGGVAGAGGALGGVVTGGGGGGGGKGGGAAATSAQQALTTALRNTSALLGTNNTALQKLATQTASNTGAINTASGKIATSNTQIIGAIGNLINALNRTGGAFSGGRRRGKKFASGGYVSGPSHAQGGVPAELEGGEYVIPKGYAAGGLAAQQKVGFVTADYLEKPKQGKTRVTKGSIATAKPTGLAKGLAGTFGTEFVNKNLNTALGGRSQFRFGTSIEGVGKDEEKVFAQAFATGIKKAIQSAGNVISKLIGAPFTGLKGTKPDFYKTFDSGFKGLLFENLIDGFNDQPLKGADLQRPFDFINGLGKFSKVYSFSAFLKYLDAKISNAAASKSGEFETKITGQLALDAFPKLQQMSGRRKGTEVVAGKDKTKFKDLARGRQGGFGQNKKFFARFGITSAKEAKTLATTFAAGGSVFASQGTDTVPAMLTPGEFVVNKKSAQKIGYGNLGKMNKYAQGGKVQYLQGGGKTAAGGMGGDVGGGALNLVFGIQMAVGALAGFTVALSSFDMKAPMTSLMALGMAGLQAGGALALLAPNLMKTIGATKAMAGTMQVLKGQFVATLPSAKNFAKRSQQQSMMPRPFGEQRTARFTEARKRITKARDKEIRTRFKAQPQPFVGRVTKDGVPTKTGAGKQWWKEERSKARKTRLSSDVKGKIRTQGGGLPNVKVFGKHLKTAIPKALRASFAGLPGLLASLIVGPLVGVIGKAVADWGFGKSEQIKGTNIEGRVGIGAEGGAQAGALESAGSAVGKGLAAAAIAAMIPGLQPFAPAIGLAVGSLELLKGAVIGADKQMEFLAFKEMSKSVQVATDSLKRFNEAETISVDSLSRLNDSLDKTMTGFDNVSAASFKREKTEQAGLLGAGGVAQRATGSVLGRTIEGGLGGAAVSGATGAGIGALAGAGTAMAIAGASAMAAAGTFGALGATIGSVVPVAGTAVGAIAGLVIGLGVGVVSSMVSANQNTKALAKSFDKAAKSITPEFMEELDKAFEKTSKNIVDNVAFMDEGVLRQMASVQTVDPEAGTIEQTKQTVSGFQQMGVAMDRAGGTTGKLVDELNRLSGTKIKVGFVKAIQDEASLLDEKAGNKLKASFQGIRGSLNDAIDNSLGSGGDLTEVFSLINNMKIDDSTKQDLKNHARRMLEEANERQRLMAVQKLSELAATRSRKALDALAAGLDQFASKMSSITNKFANLASTLQDEFSQITGERTVGKLNQINPFSKENLANASDVEIESGIRQLESLGAGGAGQAAFRDMGSLVQGQRDFPVALAKIGEGLQHRALEAEARGEGGLSNVVVQNSIMDGLSAAGIEFGSLATKSLEGKLGTLGTASGRDPKKLLFSGQKLNTILEEGGDVHKLLAEIITKATEKFAEMTDSLIKFKQSVLEVSRIQEQMAKHRLTSELAILDKQESIRNRVNQALKRSPDAIGQAVDDLQNRISLLSTGGVPAGRRSAAPIKKQSAFDLDQLFGRLQGLEDRRTKLRELAIEPSAETTAGMSRTQVRRLTTEFHANSSEVSDLSREIVGVKSAINTLANDTRILAAIESEIAKEQGKAQESQESFLTLLTGIDKLNRKEITRKEFKGQFVDPVSIINKAFAGPGGPGLDFSEAVRLLQMIASGDSLASGLIGDKFDKLVAQDQRPGGKGRSREELIEVFLDRLRLVTGREAGRVLGDQNIGGMLRPLGDMLRRSLDARSEAEALGDTLQMVGDKQVNALERMLSHEQNQMGKVLTAAHKGFRRAIGQFQKAVTQFAKFRGKNFAKGGLVRGPSHAQGGVSAVLEGGEYVIPKGGFQQAHSGGTVKKSGIIDAKAGEVVRTQKQEGNQGQVGIVAAKNTAKMVNTLDYLEQSSFSTSKSSGELLSVAKSTQGLSTNDKKSEKLLQRILTTLDQCCRVSIRPDQPRVPDVSIFSKIMDQLIKFTDIFKSLTKGTISGITAKEFKKIMDERKGGKKLGAEEIETFFRGPGAIRRPRGKPNVRPKQRRKPRKKPGVPHDDDPTGKPSLIAGVGMFNMAAQKIPKRPAGDAADAADADPRPAEPPVVPHSMGRTSPYSRFKDILGTPVGPTIGISRKQKIKQRKERRRKRQRQNQIRKDKAWRRNRPRTQRAEDEAQRRDEGDMQTPREALKVAKELELERRQETLKWSRAKAEEKRKTDINRLPSIKDHPAEHKAGRKKINEEYKQSMKKALKKFKGPDEKLSGKERMARKENRLQAIRILRANKVKGQETRWGDEGKYTLEQIDKEVQEEGIIREQNRKDKAAQEKPRPVDKSGGRSKNIFTLISLAGEPKKVSPPKEIETDFFNIPIRPPMEPVVGLSSLPSKKAPSFMERARNQRTTEDRFNFVKANSTVQRLQMDGAKARERAAKAKVDLRKFRERRPQGVEQFGPGGLPAQLLVEEQEAKNRKSKRARLNRGGGVTTTYTPSSVEASQKLQDKTPPKTALDILNLGKNLDAGLKMAKEIRRGPGTAASADLRATAVLDKIVKVADNLLDYLPGGTKTGRWALGGSPPFVGGGAGAKLRKPSTSDKFAQYRHPVGSKKRPLGSYGDATKLPPEIQEIDRSIGFQRELENLPSLPHPSTPRGAPDPDPWSQIQEDARDLETFFKNLPFLNPPSPQQRQGDSTSVGGGAAGGVDGAQTMELVLEGGKEAVTNIKTALIDGTQALKKVIVDTFGQTHISGEFSVPPVRVIVSAEGLASKLDPDLDTKIATAIRSVINPSDGSVNPDMSQLNISAANNGIMNA